MNLLLLVKKFLEKNHLGVLSIVDLEGYPHGATLHYAMNSENFELYFMTSKLSHKAQTLIHGETVKASVVIGFSENEWLTLQMEGLVHMALLPEEQTRAKTAYYGKFPLAEKNNDLVALIFKPEFWKYTDYNKKPWKIMTSEDK